MIGGHATARIGEHGIAGAREHTADDLVQPVLALDQFNLAAEPGDANFSEPPGLEAGKRRRVLPARPQQIEAGIIPQPLPGVLARDRVILEGQPEMAAPGREASLLSGLVT
ncbi:MAG: hypothetical protein VX501_10000 [Pseudomonadota bacterium]|nr:hypothetical protein [Pseudomonadota bacterium]